MLLIVLVEHRDHPANLALLRLGDRVQIDMVEHELPKLHHRFLNPWRHPDVCPVQTAVYHIMNQRIEPVPRGTAQNLPVRLRNVFL